MVARRRACKAAHGADQVVLTVLEGVLTVLLEAAAAEAHMVGSGGGLGRGRRCGRNLGDIRPSACASNRLPLPVRTRWLNMSKHGVNQEVLSLDRQIRPKSHPKPS